MKSGFLLSNVKILSQNDRKSGYFTTTVLRSVCYAAAIEWAWNSSYCDERQTRKTDLEINQYYNKLKTSVTSKNLYGERLKLIWGS